MRLSVTAAKKIQEYTRNQLKEDREYDQMTFREHIDLFTGGLVKQKNQEESGAFSG